MSQSTEGRMPLVNANEHKYCGGVWYPLDERLFRKRVERVADMAGNIDFFKKAFTDLEQREKLTRAVALLHEVAMHYDDQHGWGLYDGPAVEGTL